MGTVVVGLVTLIVLALVVLPAVALIRRFRAGDEPVAGGSMGRQLFGRKDDWGPTSSKPS